MLKVLEQAHASRSGTSLHDRRHQAAADAVRLCRGVDGERPHSGDRPALIEEIGADDAPLGLGDHTPDPGMRDEVARELPGCFQRGEVAREPVVVM
jgi:hypothetical protein